MEKVAVIGSGPSGLMAIYSLIESGYNNITLFESDNQIGKRIKVSGNGRCNFFHSPITYDKYSNPKVAEEYMELFLDNKDRIFSDLGFVYIIDDEGRMYPRSESSKMVVNLFSRFLKKHNVNIRLNSRVDKIYEKEEKVFLSINNVTEEYDKVILAIGGFSYLYNIEQKLDFLNISNIKISKITPSLTPIKTEKYLNKALEGKRFKVNLSLIYKDKLVYDEKGEILFKKDGVSGIVTFNISSYLARLHLDSYKDYRLEIDFAYDLSEDELETYLYNNNFTLEENLENLFIEELKDELIKKGVNNVIKNIKHYSLKIVSLYPFKDSQVTSGGILNKSINHNKSLINMKNVYPCGEILDIDGLCGGYNIAFAFASGYYVGKCVTKKD